MEIQSVPSNGSFRIQMTRARKKNREEEKEREGKGLRPRCLRDIA